MWRARGSGDRANERVGEHSRNVESRLLGNLDKARRARDVHLRQAIADHIESDDQHPFVPQRLGERFTDFTIALGQRPSDAASADGEIAAGLAGFGNPSETVWNDLAGD